MSTSSQRRALLMQVTRKVAVVVPCYKVRRHILLVLARMPAWVSWIICVDDACPEQTGNIVDTECRDERVRVVRNNSNLGVGGAVVRGYREALDLGADIVVKIDGDGQMDPHLAIHFVQPIAEGIADYTKGNRFYRPESLRGMPPMRLLGNAVLSLFAKLSTGYWHIVDPTNGYTAVHADVLRLLPLDKLQPRFFFETDLLFRMGTVRAVVMDVPMDCIYANEKSSLSILPQFLPFLAGHVRNLLKRFVYCYLARDFSLASVMAILGCSLATFGGVFGAVHWWLSVQTGQPASAGTVMVAALPLVIGLQMLLSALNYDISAVPREPIHRSSGALGATDRH